MQTSEKRSAPADGAVGSTSGLGRSLFSALRLCWALYCFQPAGLPWLRLSSPACSMRVRHRRPLALRMCIGRRDARRSSGTGSRDWNGNSRACRHVRRRRSLSRCPRNLLPRNLLLLLRNLLLRNLLLRNLEPPPAAPESEFDRRLDEQGGQVSEELTVTLIWDDDSDLDLQVFCPDGGVTGVAADGCGGGTLDIDANGYETGGLQMMDRPVENVLFGTSALSGVYQIQIRISANYVNRTGNERTRNLGSHPFRVRVFSRGTEQVFEGVHPGADGANVWFEFTH